MDPLQCVQIAVPDKDPSFHYRNHRAYRCMKPRHVQRRRQSNSNWANKKAYLFLYCFLSSVVLCVRIGLLQPLIVLPASDGNGARAAIQCHRWRSKANNSLSIVIPNTSTARHQFTVIPTWSYQRVSCHSYVSIKFILFIISSAPYDETCVGALKNPTPKPTSKQSSPITY